MVMVPHLGSKTTRTGFNSVEDIFQVNPDRVKTKFRFAKIDEENSWRVNLAKEIVNLKQNVLKLDPDTNTLSDDELQDILDYICTSLYCINLLT